TTLERMGCVTIGPSNSSTDHHPLHRVRSSPHCKNRCNYTKLAVATGAREPAGMSDLRDWLRNNKFEQYADAFEANDIDLDILPELSERDLKHLALSLGNRGRH